MRGKSRPVILVSEALARATHALTVVLRHLDLHTQLHSERLISIADCYNALTENKAEFNYEQL